LVRVLADEDMRFDDGRVPELMTAVTGGCVPAGQWLRVAAVACGKTARSL
jgi:hypothetical protein